MTFLVAVATSAVAGPSLPSPASYDFFLNQFSTHLSTHPQAFISEDGPRPHLSSDRFGYLRTLTQNPDIRSPESIHAALWGVSPEIIIAWAQSLGLIDEHTRDEMGMVFVHFALADSRSDFVAERTRMEILRSVQRDKGFLDSLTEAERVLVFFLLEPNKTYDLSKLSPETIEQLPDPFRVIYGISAQRQTRMNGREQKLLHSGEAAQNAVVALRESILFALIEKVPLQYFRRTVNLRSWPESAAQLSQRMSVFGVEERVAYLPLAIQDFRFFLGSFGHLEGEDLSKHVRIFPELMISSDDLSRIVEYAEALAQFSDALPREKLRALSEVQLFAEALRARAGMIRLQQATHRRYAPLDTKGSR